MNSSNTAQPMCFGVNTGRCTWPPRNPITMSRWPSISNKSHPKAVRIQSQSRPWTVFQSPPNESEARDAFINSIALLKRNVLAAPFEQAFKEQKQLESSGSNQGQLMQMHYRDEEAIYVRASADRVTVIFSTVFREETDRIFGKVFLQACANFPYFVLFQTAVAS